MTVALADPYGLGVDVALQGDVAPVWGFVAGFTNLGFALARRLNAELASLFYDLAYGDDLSDLLHQGMTPADIANISKRIQAQCLLDERVQTCRASLSLVPQTGELTITIAGTIPQGVPFTLILAATSVTVQLLSVNGQAVSAPAAPAAGAAGAAGSTTVIVQEGSSVPGPPGPAGPGGSASLTFNLNPNGYADSSGSEVVVDQFDANLGALAGSITFELVAAVKSQSGTATFQVRTGGSDGLPDGTVVATITATTSSFTIKNGGTPQTNPTGLQRIKLTIASSAAGQDAAIDRGATLTIR